MCSHIKPAKDPRHPLAEQILFSTINRCFNIELLCTTIIDATPSNIPSNHQVSGPTAEAPGGWSNDYIAIFVVCPLGLGAAIFLAVYFGKKRKAEREAKQTAEKSDANPNPRETTDRTTQQSRVLMDRFPPTKWSFNRPIRAGQVVR